MLNFQFSFLLSIICCHVLSQRYEQHRYGNDYERYAVGVENSNSPYFEIKNKLGPNEVFKMTWSHMPGKIFELSNGQIEVFSTGQNPSPPRKCIGYSYNIWGMEYMCKFDCTPRFKKEMYVVTDGKIYQVRDNHNSETTLCHWDR